ncbi:DUF4097 family beta strand repeat protein [Paenibacillus albidus]|uniref:DUF4097 family beta strand repeat-containing protein n=1 Tax=Paenibacillus albidus TaxID=2041023 RepID=UPI001BEB86D0|nr:DUF4097 family beta strand repeat-containing protein [Paenibacillus albidus]MBT2289354.1 DUF4097 family beta strand repeat protein [Paenibacillus albidus]
MKKRTGYKWLTPLAAAFLMLGIAGCGDKAVEQTASFAGGEVQQIQIHTDGQSVKVSRSEDAEVKIRMKASGELPAVLDGDVLTVNLEPASGFIHLKSATLYLEIPDQSYQSISLITTSGDIELADAQARDIQLAADSGSITVSGYTGTVEAATQSGKINSSLADPADIKNDGGGQSLKLTIDGADTGTSVLSAKSQSGNISVEK